MSKAIPTRPRPAVYKCILPCEELLAASGQPRKRSRRLPFPPWPYIDDPHQPCYLPTLLGARYFLNRSSSVEIKKVAKIAEKYLLRQENIEPEIREQAIAFVKAYQVSNRHLSKGTNQPAILLGLGRNLINVRECGDSVDLILEAGIQGLIYGNFKSRDGSNFYGVEEAFAVAHEYAHAMARGFRNGVILEKFSEEASIILCHLTADESVSCERRIELWTRFDEINTYISGLAEKFEPLEEIYATYLGLRFSPIEVRNQVEARVKEELGQRNWLKAYRVFAEECDSDDSPIATAGLIFETVCRMLEHIDSNVGHIVRNIDYAYIFEKLSETHEIIFSNIEIVERVVQEKSIDIDHLDLWNIRELLNMVGDEDVAEINYILEQAERDFSWFAAAIMRIIITPHLTRHTEAIINNDGSHDEEGIYRCAPQITLTGWKSGKFISFHVIDCGQKHTSHHTSFGRIFFESLRQQLSHDCTGKGHKEEKHKVFCPFSFMKTCCGYKERFERLFERLPEEGKKHFQLSNCNRPFEGYHYVLLPHSL